MSLPAELVIWGAAGHAKVLRECVSGAGARVVALFDNDAAVASPIEDVPLWHGWEGFERWRASRDEPLPGCLVAIGGDRGEERLEIQRRLEAAGLEPAIARHPTAFVAPDATIGRGSQVLAGATLAVEVAIGEGCIVNTKATVDHECRLADGVHVGPGATLAGCVGVGPNAMIGAGATVLPRIEIGAGAVVGAGALVNRDVSAGAVVVGNPARPMRRRDGQQ